MIQNLKVKWVSALEKVFADREPSGEGVFEKHSMLKGDRFSIQLAYFFDGEEKERGEIEVIGGEGISISVRRVELVPCAYPAHKKYDSTYITVKPGIYPDLLRELNGREVSFIVGQWRSLWLEFSAEEKTPAGYYQIECIIKKGNEEERKWLCLEVIDASLPKLPLYHTEWFHYDGISDYYGVEVFGKEHFRIVEEFIKTAVRRNCNMILTPIFTPPLDTAKGGERKTVQLVGVFLKDGNYFFDFEKFRTFVKMAEEAGMEYFEISHLFSQWGAESTPKIIVKENGEETKKFFWHTKANSEEYRTFLNAFLPELLKEIESLGIAEKCFFHISDEPNLEQADRYQTAKELVGGWLKDYPILDAISNYEFYEKGWIDIPVCAGSHIEPFLKKRPKNLWTYYCTAQKTKVSNRFIVQEGYCTRVLGAQLYKYHLEGFLHWGYNFYNSDLSLTSINPYACTDAGGAFPSGDPFLVYPGKDGKPEESIRLILMDQAMNDVRALTLLEQLTNRKRVLALVDAEGELTFSEYPKNRSFLISLREKVNEEIQNALKR